MLTRSPGLGTSPRRWKMRPPTVSYALFAGSVRGITGRKNAGFGCRLGTMVKDDCSTWVEVEQVSHKFRIGYHPDFHKHAIQRHGFFFAGLGFFIGQPDPVRFAEHSLPHNT